LTLDRRRSEIEERHVSIEIFAVATEQGAEELFVFRVGEAG
jgi:hypothetical protein